VNRSDYYELVITKRMKLTQHDCYKAATQHIHEKCFDIQVCVVVVVFLRLTSFFSIVE